MNKAVVCLGALLALGAMSSLAEEATQAPRFRADVNMVMVTFTVTDGRGRHIQGLKPKEVRILEDGTAQPLHSFSEGRQPVPIRNESGEPLGGNSVFILFDTSNCMYEGFVHAVDTAADFIRRLDEDDAVAVHTFSRNMYRSVPLTTDHEKAIAGLRRPVTGDDTALYNAMLLTVRDAAKVPGRKTLIVFSNGNDNASIVAPDDVMRIAADEGISIYMIHTLVPDPISTAAFTRLTANTGGQDLYAATWKNLAESFEIISEDLKSSYTVTYHAEPSETGKYRKLEIDLLNDPGRRYRIHTRAGYYPARIPLGSADSGSSDDD